MKAKELNAALPYATEDEVDWLTDWAKNCLGSLYTPIVVMLGAGPGIMTLALRDGAVVSINLYLVDIDEMMFEYTRAHLKTDDFLLDHRISLHCICGDSYDLGKNWWSDQAKCIDLLIIDADHSYGAVRKDIQAWWPHVRNGGLVFFHDCLERDGGFNGSGPWKESGVVRAIEDERKSSWVFVGSVGISQIYKKVE